jgi:hypothetical protein
VVLSLADQRLTLEHDETLQPFEKRMLDQDSEMRKYTDPCEELVASSNKISRWPWPRKMRLELSRLDEKIPGSSYYYPVDIRLDSAAPFMWIRRLLGQVDGVRVYTGPLVKV